MSLLLASLFLFHCLTKQCFYIIILNVVSVDCISVGSLCFVPFLGRNSLQCFFFNYSFVTNEMELNTFRSLRKRRGKGWCKRRRGRRESRKWNVRWLKSQGSELGRKGWLSFSDSKKRRRSQCPLKFCFPSSKKKT